MAGKVNTNMSVVVACLVALIQISSSLAATLTVGGSSGWTNNGVDYTTWATNNPVTVGDTLVFTFTTGAHSVVEVSKSDYDACSTSSSPITTGPASISVKTAGAHYYICTFPGHCSSGQKLSITATASSSSTPSAPTPSSPTTESPPPPSTTTTTTTSPPPPSSSAVVAGAGLVMPFLIGAAAFLM